MKETDYRDPMVILLDQWEKLSPVEKSLCVSYRRILIYKENASSSLVLLINQIHCKYPDFHIGCMPDL